MKESHQREEALRIVETYSDLILRLCYTYLKNTQDAEDICQDTFLKLLTGSHRFSSPEHENRLQCVQGYSEKRPLPIHLCPGRVLLRCRSGRK